jgi:hypothetical protein
MLSLICLSEARLGAKPAAVEHAFLAAAGPERHILLSQ